MQCYCYAGLNADSRRISRPGFASYHLRLSNKTLRSGYPRIMATHRQWHALETYTMPSWASKLKTIPEKRFALGLLPTPVHHWRNFPGLPDGFELWIKRDDLSGMQLSGNKVRKLEFLVAEALSDGSDSIVTVGGVQSNHCRATAVAARYAGLEAHLVLRNSRTLVDQDPGLVGNLLVERLVGAHVHQVSKEEYVQNGGTRLGKLLVEELQAKGRQPTFIPVGGSNAVGTWGYLEFIRELEEQSPVEKFTDIVMACGSGGTTAGIALGNHLSGYGARVWAFGVCDDPDYFLDFIDGLFRDLGAPEGVRASELLTVVQAKGAGYAISQSDELQVMKDVAEATGVVLDPVYSGKAVVGFQKEVNSKPEEWKGRKVLFLHTGGLLGMYDKLDQLQPLVAEAGKSHRLKVQ